jgi:hypothetical protein
MCGSTAGMSISRPETLIKKGSTKPKIVGPRECRVSVRILSLSDLNQSANTFNCELIMFLLWEGAHFEFANTFNCELISSCYANTFDCELWKMMSSRLGRISILTRRGRLG